MSKIATAGTNGQFRTTLVGNLQRSDFGNEECMISVIVAFIKNFQIETNGRY